MGVFALYRGKSCSSYSVYLCRNEVGDLGEPNARDVRQLSHVLRVRALCNSCLVSSLIKYVTYFLLMNCVQVRLLAESAVPQLLHVISPSLILAPLRSTARLGRERNVTHNAKQASILAMYHWGPSH
jgi:hypothetical protein